MTQLTQITPFSTKIFFTELVNTFPLIDRIVKLRDEFPSGEHISNAGGWQSKKYEFNSLEWMLPLFEQMLPPMGEVYKLHGINNVNIGNYWFNINPRYSYNNSHTHGNSYFSAVVYIKVPKNSGTLMFERPDPFRDYVRFDTLNENNFGDYEINPSENLMVIFPSYLRHYVKQNLCMEEDNERISIAFNFM